MALSVTRIDGLLVPALLLVHSISSGEGRLRDRVRRFGYATAPAICGAIPLVGAIYWYFGSVVPHTLLAKARLSGAVSGRFAATTYLWVPPFNESPWAMADWLLFCVVAAVGLATAIAHAKERVAAVHLWVPLYIVAFQIGRAPNSPWYYAPVLPALAVSFGLGCQTTTRLVLSHVALRRHQPVVTYGSHGHSC
jgi:hypothetical protein